MFQRLVVYYYKRNKRWWWWWWWFDHKGTCAYFLAEWCCSKLCCNCCNNHRNNVSIKYRNTSCAYQWDRRLRHPHRVHSCVMPSRCVDNQQDLSLIQCNVRCPSKSCLHLVHTDDPTMYRNFCLPQHCTVNCICAAMQRAHTKIDFASLSCNSM